MTENKKEVDPTKLKNIKALNIDIAKMLKQNPKAIAANIYYVITDGELDIKAMEILSPPEEK